MIATMGFGRTGLEVTRVGMGGTRMVWPLRSSGTITGRLLESTPRNPKPPP